MIELKSLFEFLKFNPTEQDCVKYLEEILWKGKTPISPFDPTSKVYECADQKTSGKNPAKYRRYRCRNTGKYFNVKNKTIFEGSNIKMKKWLLASWLYSSHKRGIASDQLAKFIDVNPKSAWFVLHRLRNASSCLFFKVMLKGEWEGDEVFLGGSNSNRHRNKKVPRCQGRNWKDKIPVFVMEQRGGNAIAQVVPNVKRKTLFPIIRANAKKGSSAYTDEYPVYKGLDKWYNHQIVVHKMGQFVKQYADGKKASTNLVENFNSHLNKMVYGTYIMISRKHAQKYVDEFTFRRNTRNYSEKDRLELLLSSTVGKRLTYRELVS